jgi:tyrosinase
MRIRKDIWNLSKSDQWHPDILWYAKAVDDMQHRPANDPTSWIYQAAIHETQEPNPQPRFWTQCQHSSWFFLPWHRMYLFYFEQIVAETIVKLGGPKDWSLPYWNYSDPSNKDATKLPPAFYAPKLPGAGNLKNALLDITRMRGNSGGAVTQKPSQTDLRPCLKERWYSTASAGGGNGFGGPVTGFHHDTDGGFGVVDAVPHGSIHIAVNGDMGSFDTAALDPIFWLHHANIDRLWNVWLKRDTNHQNPPDSTWLTGLKFEFHDAGKNVVAMTCSQVANSTASPLSYQYEDESDPIAGRAGLITSRSLSMTDKSIPEMVGATAKPVTLMGTTASASFSVAPPTGPGRAAEDAEPPRIYLNLENVRGPKHPTSYSVYVNLPSDENAEKHPELLAGNMPLFGLAEATRSSAHRSGSGLHYAYEIGDIVRLLQDKGDWDPNNVRVTFVPDYEIAGRAGETESSVQVGRISLYHNE